MGRNSICTECRKKHRGKPPCLTTGKPCAEIEAGLASENAGSRSVRWKDIALVGTAEELEGLAEDRGLRKPREYYLAQRGTSQ